MRSAGTFYSHSVLASVSTLATFSIGVGRPNSAQSHTSSSHTFALLHSKQVRACCLGPVQARAGSIRRPDYNELSQFFSSLARWASARPARCIASLQQRVRQRSPFAIRRPTFGARWPASLPALARRAHKSRTAHTHTDAQTHQAARTHTPSLS